jgi:hypothetical protein
MSRILAMLKTIEKVWKGLATGFRRTSKKADLAFCAVFRDEAPYLDEWIRFHLAQGVSHFYLYNHESSDHFEETIAPWQAQGIVTLRQVGSKHQEDIYTECLGRARKKFRWIGFLDIDEFIFSSKGMALPEVLKEYSNFAAVFVFWKLFGSGGRDFQSRNGVIESFTSCLGFPESAEQARLQVEDWKQLRYRDSGKPITGSPLQGKCLINLSKVKSMTIHFPGEFKGEVVDEQKRTILKQSEVSEIYTSDYAPTIDQLRINHYWSRGREALVEKFSKPGVAKKPRDPDTKKLIEAALVRESMLNSDRDYTILNYWRPISAPRIFLIGFNKTATRAFSAFFDGNGIPAIHWDENKMAGVMASNLSNGRKVLDGYDSEFKFFSDFISLTESSKTEGNSFFREMDLHYPGSYFILNNRDTASWILSRELHNKGIFLEKNMSIMQTDDPDVVRAQWKKEKETHEREVREYFKGRRDFIEIDINSDGIPQKLSEFLEMELNISLWQVVGKT